MGGFFHLFPSNEYRHRPGLKQFLGEPREPRAGAPATCWEWMISTTLPPRRRPAPYGGLTVHDAHL